MPKRIVTTSPSGNRTAWPTDGAAKSKCACGHTGDGTGSQHAESRYGVPGHGPCVMVCKCQKFEWDGWLPGKGPRRVKG